MKDSIYHQSDLLSPAYVYDQTSMINVLDRLSKLKDKTGCLPLYSIKSANMVGLLDVIKPYVSGFSCSSLFEVKLAKEILNAGQTVHITTPGYRPDEWDDIIGISDYVTLNSIPQWQAVAKKIAKTSSCGIRINPELSFVNDERYDPCRPDSKLGISFEQLAHTEETLNWDVIEGVHIHNNCESVAFDELKQSMEQTIHGLNKYSPVLKWVNLGGGYFFQNDTNVAPLQNTIKWLQDEYNVDVYLEPGKAITGNAAKLVTTVIDLVETKNKTIAVLDTTINHLPEVFEYQYQPKVMNAIEEGDYKYRLVGCSCLSGDIFGDYTFNLPIQVGSRIVFENIGAYMQVKANMFNGINLPSTYLLDENKKLILLRQYAYEDFRSRL